jgi:hypothetical protein
MEQVIPKPPVKKAWPLMTPAERLAIWEDARLAWAHDAAKVARIDALLTTLTVIDVDSRIAQLSGQLRASYGIKPWIALSRPRR